MSTVVHFTAAEIAPTVAAVLSFQGVPPTEFETPRTRTLAEDAIALFLELAEPAGIFRPLTSSDFAAVYRGRGENAPDTPVARIYPRAALLALFAVTAGAAVSDRIATLFARNEFALAAMLDAAASEGAEQAAEALDGRYRVALASDHAAVSGSATLRFSPGYCGWNVTGQPALFAHLRPEQIGIELSPSCLMHPLKSISGVLLSGPREIFAFGDDFPFCAQCDTHSCRERIERLSRHD